MTDQATTSDPIAVLEAAIAASGRPLSERELASYLEPGTDLSAALAALVRAYEGRGVIPVMTAGGWTLRTRPVSSGIAARVFGERHALGKAATETLTAIALFAPVTRSEIERVRGVTLAKGTMDALLLAGLIRPGPRREGPGRPLTWTVTDRFLELYDLDAASSIPQWQQIRDEALNDMRRSRNSTAPDASDDPADADSEPNTNVFDDEITHDDLLHKPAAEPGDRASTEK